MQGSPSDAPEETHITVSPDVIDYIERRNCDFRVCTSCGGPILLPVRVKPPKKSDLLLHAASHIIYVSIHQARFLDEIRSDMIPFYEEDLAGYGQR